MESELHSQKLRFNWSSVACTWDFAKFFQMFLMWSQGLRTTAKATQADLLLQGMVCESADRQYLGTC
jgi:hypothetical protein